MAKSKRQHRRIQLIMNNIETAMRIRIPSRLGVGVSKVKDRTCITGILMQEAMPGHGLLPQVLHVPLQSFAI